jgi:hypothetical protein
MDAWSLTTLSPHRRTELKGWALLAIGSLAIAGLLALVLGLSRTPKIGDWFPSGQHFFYRALVTHVVLSFEVWYLAALGALTVLVAPAGPAWVGRTALGLGIGGVLLLLVPALADTGEPSLNNYVPVVIHPLFYAGLAMHAAGVALACGRVLPLARSQPGPVVWGIITAAVAYLLACFCFFLAWVLIPPATELALLNERLFWGGGHVLQIVNTCIVMVAWQMLCERHAGVGPLSPMLSRACFSALLLFALASPAIYAKADVLGLAHRQAFTDLLWYGLPLPPLVMGAGLAFRLLKGRRDWRSPAFLSLVLSLVLFGVGGFFGFFLGVADTRTPSHYHAVIGGVQLGLMGVFLVAFLPAVGRSIGTGRGVRWQFHLYGWGQLVHALGFFMAGAAGVARKTAGAAQGLDSVWKKVAMGVVGMGTGLAVLGGVIFVWMVLARLLKREPRGE